jgi:tRNA threonylcarbamoyl adenosine modification protein YeaZ
MKILALEFSSERRSVAVVADGVVRGSAEESGGRSTRAFGLIERALGEAKVDRDQIECIAVGLGPGSYAGIRVAVSIAQGWQVARGVPLLGVGSVECMASQAQAAGMGGRVNILIDAQRNEFYFAAYEVREHILRPVEPLRLIQAQEAGTLGANGQSLIWPDLLSRFPHGRVMLPDAGMLGQLASKRTDFVSGDRLEPIYLRETTFVKAPPARVIPPLPAESSKPKDE